MERFLVKLSWLLCWAAELQQAPLVARSKQEAMEPA